MAEIYGYIWFSIQWLCSAVSGYFIFKKAGQEGWKSLVPLCGGAICYLLVWEPGYYFVYVILAALFFVFPQIIIFGIAAGILRFIFLTNWPDVSAEECCMRSGSGYLSRYSGFFLRPGRGNFIGKTKSGQRRKGRKVAEFGLLTE